RRTTHARSRRAHRVGGSRWRYRQADRAGWASRGRGRRVSRHWPNATRRALARSAALSGLAEGPVRVRGGGVGADRRGACREWCACDSRVARRSSHVAPFGLTLAAERDLDGRACARSVTVRELEPSLLAVERSEA